MPAKTFLIALLFVTSPNLANLPGQDSGCTRRTVPVGVVDREWNFVQGLSAANFRGRLRGHDVEILSAYIDTSPRLIVLLLDASGSMQGERWETAKSLSEHLIQFAPPRASIAQMAFSERVLGTVGFDQDRSVLPKTLAALVKVCEHPHLGGRTALFDTIASARDTFGGLAFGDVIFAVTDGGDNRSRTEAEKVEQNLLRGGIRLFSALFEDQDRRTLTLGSVEKEIEGANRFLSMIEATGGNTLTLLSSRTSPPNPYLHLGAGTRNDAIDLALQRLCEQMGEFYRLELRLPVTLHKPTKWKLEVIEANAKPGRRVEVHYPAQFMPCAKASE
jgi:hypothetical protein